jgi:hypothetical protein
LAIRQLVITAASFVQGFWFAEGMIDFFEVFGEEQAAGELYVAVFEPAIECGGADAVLGGYLLACLNGER